MKHIFEMLKRRKEKNNMTQDLVRSLSMNSLISAMKIRKLLTVMLSVLIFATVFAVAGTVNVDASPSTVIDITFYQMNFNLDGTIYENTDWGSVNFTFIGQEPIMYFNLAVNGEWQVQNIPVLSMEGEGVTQSISFTFGLGVPSGTVVTSLDYGYTFTDITIGSMPAETGTAVVSDLEIVINSGAKGEEIPPLQPAKPLVGGAAVANPKKHAHANFPNQECGDDECAPTAVSNSLKFLNKKHNLGLDDNDLSIAKMKEATNWGNPVIGGKPVGWGTWIDHDKTRPAGERNAWWEDKRAYMEKNNIPVTTRKITDLSKLAAEIDDGQDVELQGDWHTAAVVGITDLGGGKYKIDVAHDTQQGKKGGTKTEPITYDPATKKFNGSPAFFDGSSFRYAIVECPEKVGGVWVPVDKPALLASNAIALAPYIGLATTILVATVAAAIYARRVRRVKKKQ